MKIEDIGFIIFIKKFEENSLFIKVLSKENGIISGYIKHGKKQNQQIGNLVKFTWTARNSNNLGSLSIELIRSYSSHFMFNKLYLNLVNLMTNLINILLYEKIFENRLYDEFEIIINLIKNDSDKYLIIKEYFLFENILLNILGTGLIFDNATKLSDLHYISPKTGLVVSKEKGDPYKEKLLLFPSLFKKNEVCKEDIIICINTFNFFLKKYLNENIYLKKNNSILILIDKLSDNL